jgi:hypothetical protein
MAVTTEPKWHQVEALCESSIEDARTRLERTTTHDQAQLIRGEIRAFRRVLALVPKPPQPDTRIQPETTDY